MKKHLLPGVLIALVAAVTFVFYVGVQRYIARQRGSELEERVAKMPLGILADEADEFVGSAPDEILRMQGVLISPVTMLAPPAAPAGKRKPYTLRTWHEGDVSATVAIDASGYVAGRWSWRDRKN